MGVVPGRRSRLVRRLAAIAAVAAAASVLSAQAPGRGAGRVVAVGDVHGSYEGFVGILRAAGLVDDALNWTGGEATFVQTGDVTDRGLALRQVLDLLMALEARASVRGGRAIALLGNHEVMNMLGETRDVNPAIYAQFVDAQSEARREAAWKTYEKVQKARARVFGTLPAVYALTRDQWMAAYPPGMLEYIEAFGPNGRYGRWLRTRPVAVKVGTTIFVHGGINPATAPKRFEDLNARARDEIRRFDSHHRRLAERQAIAPSFTLDRVLAGVRAEAQALAEAANQGNGPLFDRLADADYLRAVQDLGRLGSWSLFDADGPLWFRGYATWTSSEGEAKIDAVLKLYDAEHVVVGHTLPSQLRITARFGAKVFLIDTGMLSSHYKGGQPSALEIDGGRHVGIYLNERVEIVATGPGAPVGAP